MIERYVDRRMFTGAMLAAATLATGAGRAAAAVSEGAIRKLYERAIVIDGLSSPTSANVPFPPVGPLTQLQLDNIRKSGITAINYTVGKPGPLVETVKEIGFWTREIDKHPDYLRLVKTADDILVAKKEGKLGIVFGFQGMHMIGTDLELIDSFAAMSVKIMQLTYNDKNALGAGSGLPVSEGLSPLGREAVARMNSNNVLVDVSHANPRTAIEAIRASRASPTISHTGCRAIFDSQRNLPDDVLRACADKGGVVGIYLMPFLGGDPVSPSRARVIRHIEHALKVCGEDHVGIGSDLSITPIEINEEYMGYVRKTAAARKAAGIGAASGESDGPITTPELNSARRLEMIAESLAANGHPPRLIEKVIGGNVFRLYREVWQGRA